MERQLIKNIIEAVLFMAGEAVKLYDLSTLFEEDEQTIREIAIEMKAEREVSSNGIQLKFVDDGIQFCSNKTYAKYVEELLLPKKNYSLSQSAIETLSIVAYRQPVTKTEVEGIRGIRCDYSVSALLDRGLICVSGKRDTIGKPNLYSTTDEFLRHFGIDSIEDMPEIDFSKLQIDREERI